MVNTFEEIGNKVNIVRNIGLKAVLKRIGCIADRYDKVKWHTPEGVISVTCQKFMNWTKGTGGGGAIDLAMHLTGCDFKTAVFWLSDNFPDYCLQISKGSVSIANQAFHYQKEMIPGYSRS